MDARLTQVTFLKLKIASVDATIWNPGSAFNVSLPLGLSLEKNDLATDEYRSMLSVSVPRCDARIMLPPVTKRTTWWEVSALSFDLGLDSFDCPIGWKQSAQAQAAFVLSQDEATNRVAGWYPSRDGAGQWFSIGKLWVSGCATDSLCFSAEVLLHADSLYLPQPLAPARERLASDRGTVDEHESRPPETSSFVSSASQDSERSDQRLGRP